MPRNDRLSDYATTAARDAEGGLIVTFHSTVVVKADRDRERIELNTGGWDTVTTRRKMTQAANQFGLPYSVFRRDFQTYVEPHSGYRARLGDGSPAVVGKPLALTGDHCFVERID